MLAEEFNESSTGKLVECEEGYVAFVPAPLPPKFVYDDLLALRLSRADAALSELAGLGRLLINPRLLISPYLHREAVLSLRIEGTHTNISDLYEEEMEKGTSHRSEDDLAEVRNYISVLESGFEQSRTVPFDLKLIKQLHLQLMQGVRGEKACPGKFRETQNWIGPHGCSGKQATFVPVPVEYMYDCLEDWERFAANSAYVPDLIACAILHHQFETIHPFVDGNGRIGRLINTLFLMKRGRMQAPLLYLSAYFESHHAEYAAQLQRVRTSGEWIPWLCFFLKGVEEISTQAVEHASCLIELRKRYNELLHDRPNALVLLDHLFTNPFINVAKTVDILSITPPTARTILRMMESKGMIEEVSGRAWKRYYVAQPILKIFEDSIPKTDFQLTKKARENLRAIVVQSEPKKYPVINSSEPMQTLETREIKRIRNIRPTRTRACRGIFAPHLNCVVHDRDVWEALPPAESEPYYAAAKEQISEAGVLNSAKSARAIIEGRAYNLWIADRSAQT